MIRIQDVERPSNSIGKRQASPVVVEQGRPWEGPIPPLGIVQMQSETHQVVADVVTGSTRWDAKEASPWHTHPAGRNIRWCNHPGKLRGISQRGWTCA